MRRTVVTALAVLMTLAGAGTADAGPDGPADVTVVRGQAQVGPGPLAWQGTCLFVGLQHDEATGQNVEGVVVAVALGDSRYPLTCYITVNGGVVWESRPVPFPGADASRATYAAGDTDSVQICAHVWPWTDCRPISPVPLSPVLDPVVYVPLCTLLPRGGIPGVYWVDWDGDVYLLGVRHLDCPPYG